MTPQQVIVASTPTAAEFLRSKDHGTVATGKVADFLVLDANPLDDIYVFSLSFSFVFSLYLLHHPNSLSSPDEAACGAARGAACRSRGCDSRSRARRG